MVDFGDQAPAQAIGSGINAGLRVAEADLIARMADGDPTALEAFYATYGPRVYTCVGRITGWRDAEDLTHDAFITAFSRAHQFRHAGSVEGWICRIAANLALKRLRTWGRIVSMLTGRADSRPALSRPAPAEVIDLERAIARLPDVLRVVFLLVALEGMTHREVSLRLGISEMASRKRYERARTLLAKGMGGR